MESVNIFNDSGEPAMPIQDIEHNLVAVLDTVTPMIQHQELSREKHASPEGEVRLLYLAQGHAICNDAAKIPWMLRMEDNDTWSQMTRKDILPMMYQFDTPLRFDRENFANKEEAFDYIKLTLLRRQIPYEIEMLTKDLEEKTYSEDILKESAEFLQMYQSAQKMLDDAGQEQDLEQRKQLERKAYLYVKGFEKGGTQAREEGVEM